MICKSMRRLYGTSSLLGIVLLSAWGCAKSGGRALAPADMALVRASVQRCAEHVHDLLEFGPSQKELREEAARLGGGGVAANKLVGYLNASEKEGTARHAVPMLLWACGEEGVPGLGRCLGDSDPAVRFTAVLMLGIMGQKGKAALPQLRKTLADENVRVRSAAIMAATRVATNTATLLPGLKKALKDKNGKVRLSAVRALLSIDKKKYASDVIPVLMGLLNQPQKDLDVPIGCCELLGEIGPAAGEAIPTLEKAKKRPLTRQFAAEALKKIREQE